MTRWPDGQMARSLRPKTCSPRYTEPSEMTKQTITHSAEETIAFGRKLAAELSPPLIVLLRGDLGAVKTTPAKGIAGGFQTALPPETTHPPSTLLHTHPPPPPTLH